MNRQLLGFIHSKSDGKCWYCSASLPPFGDWQIEHQTPRAQGGSDDPANLVAACRECNTRKGNRTVEKYRTSLIAKLENRITESVEYCYELSAAFGHDPSMWMPVPLLAINDALSELAEKAVHLELRFFGELHTEAVERIKRRAEVDSVSEAIQ